VIDLHCHILPGVDDGAADLEDAVAMARQAEADGIEVVCATPHVRADHDVRLPELPRRVGELNGELADRRIGVRVVPGGEVSETMAPELSAAELSAASLGESGRWILLEPAPGPLGDSLADAVDSLAALGHDCLIAHPERHAGPDLHERLRALVERGALVQVTAAHLAEGDAVGGMLELADHGLVHLLGSDAHSARHGRRLELSPGLDRLREVRWLRAHLTWIARDAPAAILRGEPLTAPFRPR
jgi:protein-tyrosine phosphatase